MPGVTKEAFPLVEGGQHIESHCRAYWVAVEGIVDYGEAAGNALHAQAMFYLLEPFDGVCYVLVVYTEGSGA